MSWRFNPPPGWPTPPEDWSPPPGWAPPSSWPSPPPDWSFWVPASETRSNKTEAAAEAAGAEPVTTALAAPQASPPDGVNPAGSPRSPDAGRSVPPKLPPELAAVRRADQPAPADVLAAIANLTALRADLDRVEQHLIDVSANTRSAGRSWGPRCGCAPARPPSSGGSGSGPEPPATRLQSGSEGSGNETSTRSLVSRWGRSVPRWLSFTTGSPARSTGATMLPRPGSPGRPSRPRWTPARGLFDLARLAVADLRTIPPSALGHVLTEALERVSALLQRAVTPGRS